MPQLHFYVPESTADRIRQRARAAGVSVSQFIAELVRQEVDRGWPEGFFEEVIGGWQGEPLERPPQGEFEAREAMRPALAR